MSIDSTEARRMVATGEITAARAVSLLSDAMLESVAGVARACPECGLMYTPVDGGYNLCSVACQSASNAAQFDLDGGRTIIMVSDITSERLAHELAKVGLHMPGRPLVPS